MSDVRDPVDGTTIAIPEDGTSSVTFPETPSTGYSWQVHSSTGVSVSSDFVPDSSTGRAGTGGVRRFTMQTPTVGTHTVTFQLRRPRGATVIDQRTIRISVEPKK